MFRRDEAEDDRRPDIDACPRRRATHHRCGRDARRIEAGDRRAVLAQYTPVDIGNHAAKRADIAWHHRHGIKGPLVDFAKRRVVGIERVAQPTVIGASTAPEGAATLARMVRQAKGRLSIMAGSGVAPGNVAQLIAETGVTAVHGSASRLGPAPDAATVRLGFAFGPRRITDIETVRGLRAAIDRHFKGI